MRRKLFLLLAVIGLVALLRGFPGQILQKDDPSDENVQFLQYEPLSPTPAAPVSLGEMQNHVDQISEAALKENWPLASQKMQRLERAWANLETKRSKQLEIEQEISLAIGELQSQVWSKDKQKVLQAAQKLTRLVSELSP